MKFLSQAELENLFVTLEKFESSNFRDCVLIRLTYATGLRASEVLSIRWRDVDFSSESIWVEAKKGGKSRRLGLSVELFAKLKRLMGDNLSRDNSERLFPITYQRFCQIWHMYRPAKKSLHSLRHTRAVEAYRISRDVKLVQQLLGHRDIRNTMVYLDFNYDLESIRVVCG